jgi:hypothetical protein
MEELGSALRRESIRLPTSRTLSKHVVPHAPGSIGSIAAQEAGAHLRAQFLIAQESKPCLRFGEPFVGVSSEPIDKQTEPFMDGDIEPP